jgi:hypothetical protein
MGEAFIENYKGLVDQDKIVLYGMNVATPRLYIEVNISIIHICTFTMNGIAVARL